MPINHGPAVIAQQQLNALTALDESELSPEQRIRIGMLAAQIEIGDRLKGIEQTLDTGKD